MQEELLQNKRISEMVQIPEGQFEREDGCFVKISAFSLAKCELTKKIWKNVRIWAVKQGYDFAEGSGVSDLKPVANITWYDAIKFCNALSEMSGLVPAYYTDTNFKSVYKKGIVDINVQMVNWEADGFRLPTEAEWEYACRAGTTTKFYWGDVYPGGMSRNPYAWFEIREERVVWTHDVAQLLPNAFGLYDMSGNVCEWCWDWHQRKYDTNILTDPKGAESGLWRIMRGGSVALDSNVASGARHYTYPAYQVYETGLRLASSNVLCKDIFEYINIQDNAIEEEIEIVEEQEDNLSFARKFFKLINLNTKGLEKCKSLIENEKFEDALCEYRDFHFKKIKGMGEQKKPSLKNIPLDDAIEICMNIKGRFPWFATMDNSYVLNRKTDFNTLVFKWIETRDDAYLKQWFFLVESLAKYHKKEFDKLTPEELTLPNHFGAPQSWDWGMGFNSYAFCFQYNNGILEVLHYLIYIMDNNECSLIPPNILARFLYFIATDEMSMIIKDPRILIGNQIIHNASILARHYSLLKEFKDAEAWLEQAEFGFKLCINLTYLPDGGDLEQTFGYNKGFCRSVIELLHIFKGQHPKWVDEVYELAIRRIRMLYALHQPFGGLPATGSGFSFYPPAIYQDKEQLKFFLELNHEAAQCDIGQYPDELLKSIDSNLFGDKQINQPGFTSIVYPYSGYSVMRDGWDTSSKYLFMISSRKGTGHACENINSIAISAYERHFLISAGADSYGCRDFVPEDQFEFMGQIDHYRDSSFGQNTVAVDGYSQKRLIDGGNTGVSPYNTTLNKRWQSSEMYDFTEGEYSDGYGDKEVTINVIHNRQVIFVRQAGFWVVLDKMIAKEPHQYTQIWNFPGELYHDSYSGVYCCHLTPNEIHDKKHTQFLMDGFHEDEVCFSEQDKQIWTTDQDAPNVFMHQFSSNNLKYKKFFGNLNPARGWEAQDIIGRRHPKVDIHTNWEGEAGVSNIITAIVPSKDEHSPVKDIVPINYGGIQGFNAILNDQTKTIFQITNNGQKIKYEGLEAQANTLIVTIDVKGRLSGLVLDCTKLIFEGKEIKLQCKDFEFEIFENNLSVVAEIKCPTGFKWVDDGKSNFPSYY